MILLCHCNNLFNVIYYYYYNIDNRIGGSAFLSLDESILKQFGVSYGFKFTLMEIIENLVCDIEINYTFCSCMHACNNLFAYCYHLCICIRKVMSNIMETGNLQQIVYLYL